MTCDVPAEEGYTVRCLPFLSAALPRDPALKWGWSEAESLSDQLQGGPKRANGAPQPTCGPHSRAEVTCTASEPQSPPESAERWGVHRWRSWREVLPLGRAEGCSVGTRDALLAGVRGGRMEGSFLPPTPSEDNYRPPSWGRGHRGWAEGAEEKSITLSASLTPVLPLTSCVT